MGTHCNLAGRHHGDLTDPNRGRHAQLRRGVVTADNTAFVRFIADGCPTHVIRIATTLSESLL